MSGYVVVAVDADKLSTDTDLIKQILRLLLEYKIPVSPFRRLATSLVDGESRMFLMFF